MYPQPWACLPNRIICRKLPHFLLLLVFLVIILVHNTTNYILVLTWFIGKLQIFEIPQIANIRNSKRAFQSQLKKWVFPSKRTSTAENLELVGAVEELWKQHVPPKEMRVVLKEKGYDLGERKLARLRASQGLYIRAPNALKQIAGAIQTPQSDKSDVEAQVDVTSRGTQTDSTDSIFEHQPATQDVGAQHHDAYIRNMTQQASAPIDSNPLDTTVSKTARRAGRARASIPNASNQSLAAFITNPTYPRPTPAELEDRDKERAHAEAEKIATQESRICRRAKHEGLKYPSEIGLGKCKKILGIDNATYRAMRTEFANICTTRRIERKKGCDIWQKTKDDLIASIPGLAAVFHDENGQAITGADLEQKALAVDLICMDLTKNMRKRATRLDIRDVKKVLGLTPTEITKAREALTQRLIAAEFTNKTEIGEARWKELKDAWLIEMKLDQRGETVLQACDVLCANVVKRLHDQKTSKRKRASEGIESQGDAEQGNGMAPKGVMSTDVQETGHGLADHGIGGTTLSAYGQQTMMAPMEPGKNAASSYYPPPDYSPYDNYVALSDGYSSSTPALEPYSTSVGLVTSAPTSGPYYTSARLPSDSPYPEIDPELLLGWVYHKPTTD